MVEITLTNEWTELPFTTGMIQGTDQITNIIISDDIKNNKGITVFPKSIYTWTNKKLYARADTSSLRVSPGTVIAHIIELVPGYTVEAVDFDAYMKKTDYLTADEMVKMQNDISIIKKYLSQRDNTVFTGE